MHSLQQGTCQTTLIAKNMINLVRLVLPYLFIVYFVVKGIKEPLYLLAIPFLMFMSESIFFEGVKLFSIPGRLYYGLMFIWLGFLWIISIIFRKDEEKNGISNTHRLNVMDFCIIGLIVISFVGLGMTLINYPILTDVHKEFTVLISLFFCYFIIKNWSSYNKPELLEKFLFSLVVVNSIACIFYLLHQGLHLKIYMQEEYLEEIFNGEEITRSSWFMPQFMFFSIAFSLVFRKKKPFLFTVILIVNLLATFITYFRSFIIIAVCLTIFYFILIGKRKGRLGLVLKNVLIYSVFSVLFFIIVLKVFPSNTKYFMSRFSELTNPSPTSDQNNLVVRFRNTGIIISNIDDNKKVLGMGSVTENQFYGVRSMRQITADMVWTAVIFRWGFVGLMLFILLNIFSINKAYNIYMKSEGVLSELALLFLLFIISQMIQSFIDWTFMSGHGFAIGLWYFAMLSALVGFYKNTDLSGEITA
jgi:hypothetical protein